MEDTMYEPSQERFTTPRGRPVSMWVRADTNDWNTAQSCLTEDEYRTRGLNLYGTALDIGAYTGGVTVALLADNPALHVVAVEPIPENVVLIYQNLALNGLTDRCTVIAGAVGKGEVTIRFRYTGSANDRHHAFVGNAYGSDEAGTHQSVTYQATEFRDLPLAEFVKIDCEGGLWAILDQMTEVPRIAGEAEPVLLPDGEVGSRTRLERILGPTHDIEWGAAPGEPGDWGFWAVAR
jgi:FkbM family methyltransferase